MRSPHMSSQVALSPAATASVMCSPAVASSAAAFCVFLGHIPGPVFGGLSRPFLGVSPLIILYSIYLRYYVLFYLIFFYFFSDVVLI